MATAPFPLAEFFDGLGLVEARFYPSDARQTEETHGGEIITASLGPSLWNVSVTVRSHPHAGAAQAVARIEELLEAGTSFMVYDPTRRFPQADPDGSILGAAAPTVGGIRTGNREIIVNGLPAGYTITRGDFVAFTYGDPSRFALHRVTQTVSAGAGGTIQYLRFNQPVRPGAANGDPITLIKPSCKAVVVPGSYDPPTHRAVISSGFSFQARQTLR